jgi:hypothetical protein
VRIEVQRQPIEPVTYRYDRGKMRRKALAFVPGLVAFALLFGFLVVALWPGPVLELVETGLLVLYRLLGIMLFASLARTMRRQGAEALTVDKDGVTFEPGVATLRWDEIAELRVEQVRLRLPERLALRSRMEQNLLFVVHDPDTALQRLPARLRKYFAELLSRYGTPFALPATLLERPTSDVVEVIGRHVPVRWLEPRKPRRLDEERS